MTEEDKRKEEEEGEEEEEHILRFKSNLPLPPIPNTNYASFLLSILSQHGGKKALMDASTGKHHTYSDICAMVPRVCAGLRAAGVGPGEPVLLMSPNHIDFPIATLAIILLPAVCVPINPSLTPKEVAHVVQVSGARWAVVEEGVAGVVEQLAPLLPPHTLKGVWVMGTSPHHPSFASLMRTETQSASASFEGGAAAFEGATSVALMPFSSGTTGLPKGVMLSHRNLLTSYFQTKHLIDLSGEEGRQQRDMVFARVLLVLPLYHIYGFNVQLSTSMQGGCVVTMGKFSMRLFLQTIEKYKITYTPLVPHIATYLAQMAPLEEYDLSSLFFLASASAPLPHTTQEALMEKTGRLFGNGYGLTETCAPVSFSRSQTVHKQGCVGNILPYVELKIVALGTSKALRAGEEGEVWVRGPGVMMGYATPPGEAPSASPRGLLPGGWLPTGDLAKVDEEENLILTDRIKDLIKVKGYQVAPSELEAVMQGMEGVGEVAVVGVPSPRLGEAPRAYVVPAPGVPAPSPQALEEYVAARVAPYKRLVGGVEVVEALPKNSIGKVLKRKLRDEFLKKMKSVADAAGTTTTTAAATTATAAATTTTSTVPSSKL